jgi:hypothetical protein
MPQNAGACTFHLLAAPGNDVKSWVCFEHFSHEHSTIKITGGLTSEEENAADLFFGF